MAVEHGESTSPENPRSRGVSPRISFSHDLCQFDVVPIEPHLPLSPSSLSASASFNFQNLLPNSSSADELFSNGVLLPFQHPKPPPPALPTPPGEDRKTGEEHSKTARKASPLSPSSPAPASTSSFWKFRRSRSCNCGGIYSGTLCPILLPRSKSTGSNSSSKRSLISKEEQQSQRRNRNLVGGGGGGAYQKPPLKKSYGANGGSGGVKVSPVLNVSSGNLFGLGSIFSSIGRGADKGNKKKFGHLV